jgi:putative ABC transport system permease protein
MTLAVVLLTGAGLLTRSFKALRTFEPEFDPRAVLTMKMSLKDERFTRTVTVNQFVRDGVARLRALPEVVDATAGCCLPAQAYLTLRFTIIGRALTGPYHGMGSWASISPTYLDVFRIPLIRGRTFTDRDVAGAPPVVLINETMARQFWPNQDPLGQQIVLGRGLGPPFDAEPVRQIIGVVGNVRERWINRPQGPATYVPVGQLSDGQTALGSQLGFMSWAVRTRGDPHALIASARKELQDLSGGLPVGQVRSMEEIIGQSTAQASFNTVVIATFAAIALLLAATGVYGVMAYVVRQQTREIGIRRALGADAARLRRQVLALGMRQAITGVIMGIPLAFGVVRTIASLLYGVSTHDALVFTTVPIVLLGVAFVAIWVPACRATRVDPMVALRCE